MPVLLALGTHAMDRDSDLLMSVLTALARIRPRTHVDATEAFAREVEEEAARNRRGFQPVGLASTFKPDRPDSPESRGEVISQLALLVRARMHPGDEVLRRRVFELLSVMPLSPQPGGGERGLYARNSLEDIHPRRAS